MTTKHESEGGKRERSGGLTVAVVVLLALPAVYLFATGPIIWLGQHGYLSDGDIYVVQCVYAPVNYILQHNSTFDVWFGHWAALWQQ